MIKLICFFSIERCIPTSNVFCPTCKTLCQPLASTKGPQCIVVSLKGIF